MSVPTPHIEAARDEVADAVLLPGDPLRAEAIATTFLQDPKRYNAVRNVLGFTGTYKGRRVSVQGTGMGMPSISIYATELIRFYGVRTAIRVGSAGALREDVKLRDVVIGASAHTTSAMNRRRFRGIDYAPTASFDLVAAAHRLAAQRSLPSHVGPLISADAFYDDDFDLLLELGRAGTLAVEMEAAALYTIAAVEGAKALCVATVSDHLVTEEHASSQERQTGFLAMAELALDVVLATS